MQLKKAVITAAGQNQRRLPLQTLIDRDGVTRTVLAIAVNEILSADIEEICIVVWPGDEAVFAQAVPEFASSLRFVPQTEPRGYGHALYCAREFTRDEPFLHLVSDHLHVRQGRGCAAEVVSVASAEGCSVSAVRATHERSISSFGVVGGQPLPRRQNLFTVTNVLEKPTPTEAEQRLVASGLRAGYYLAFFGLHVLTPLVLDTLGSMLRDGTVQRPVLSHALAAVAQKERYLALQVDSERYDLGTPYGLLASQLALALSGRDRDEVLTLIVNLLASERQRATVEPLAAEGSAAR
jgi:UTP--glucose-1-phosphate uridylyltransferase